jgi:methyl-accepting chemotaxis protein
MAFLPVFVVSFLVLSGVSYYVSRRALLAASDETAFAVGARYAGELSANMESISASLGIVTEMRDIKEARDKEKIVAILANVFEQTGVFDVLFFVWPDGSAIRSVNTEFDASDREYFKQVSSAKSSYISEVTISSSSGKPSVMVCEPVMDGDEFKGLLGVTYNLERMDGIMANVKFKKSGYGFIMDRNGLIISNPTNPATIGKFNVKSNLDVDKKLSDLFLKTEADWDSEVVGDFTFEGVRYEGVFVPIKLKGGQRWLVGISAPISEVNEDIAALSRIMALISAIFIVVALVFVVIVSRKIAAPIVRIRDECLIMEGGDLRERSIDVVSNDEIGELAVGFAAMKRNLIIHI